MKKLMMWLGLGPDEAYEGYDSDGDEPVLRGPLSSTEFAEARAVAETGGTVSPCTPGPRSPGRCVPFQPNRRARCGPCSRRLTAKPTTVSPTSFNDVQPMADRFMAKQPVIVNLQGVDADLSRRIIDFASGVCYGGVGQMERITHQVYLMTPSDVEVSEEDRRHLAD